MAVKKKVKSILYEFKPNGDITPEQIKELAELVRIGIGVEVYEKASVELRNQFEVYRP